MDADLSSLAGKDVKFILTIQANGSSSQDRAQWLVPKIVKQRSREERCASLRSYPLIGASRDKGAKQPEGNVIDAERMRRARMSAFPPTKSSTSSVPMLPRPEANNTGKILSSRIRIKYITSADICSVMPTMQRMLPRTRS